MKIHARTFAAASTFMLALITSASAQNFGNFYAFGDSLTDCCVSGRFTNSNAPNWADQVPGLIGAMYSPSPLTNLAIGGAQSGGNNALPDAFGSGTGFLPQISRFQAQNVAISSRDVAGIWIGTNDI